MAKITAEYRSRLKEVTLVLSPREAALLRTLLGKVAVGSPIDDEVAAIFDSLYALRADLPTLVVGRVGIARDGHVIDLHDVRWVGL